MNKIYMLSLAATLALPAFAAKPFVKGQHPMAPAAISTSVPSLRSVAREIAAKTILSEDFAAFADGSEAAPAPEIAYHNDYYIPADMTSTPGWSGQGVHPAGGAVALMKFKDNRFGFISTPPQELGGTAIITLRAKNLTSSPSSLWISLCDDEYGAGPDQIDIPLSDEWQTYTFTATFGSLTIPSYFQIQTEKADALVDDIKIDYKRDRIAAPQANYAVNNSPTSFTASWSDIGAPEYLLSVACTAKAENGVEGTLSENFDGIKVSADGTTIDKANPNYPEGWEIDLSSHGESDVCTTKGDYKSAPLSLHFEAEGDVITSPATPEPICGLKFWVKPDSDLEDPDILSMLCVEIYHSLTGKWENVAQIPYYWMSMDGDFYPFNPEIFGDDTTRVRISMVQKGAITFYVDDVVIDYSTRGVRTMLLEDFPVAGTSYTVDNIVPENEYHYYVKAKDGELTSNPSELIWVDGLQGLKPTALPASDIKVDGFTANWQKMPHADSYEISLSKTINATKDMTDVTLLAEDFEAINSEGTDWQNPFNYAAKGWADTGWCATQPSWREGMAGTSGTSWLGEAGLVFTPELNLEAIKSHGLHVSANIVTVNDMIRDSEGKPVLDNGNPIYEGIFAMVLYSPSDKQATASALVEMPEAGANAFDAVIPLPADIDLKKVIVAFMSKTGGAFFIDDVRLSADLDAGASISVPFFDTAADKTSMSFSDLDNDVDYSYRVKASASRKLIDYISEFSDPVAVSLDKSAVELLDKDLLGSEAEYFNLQGMRVANPEAGIYIRLLNGKSTKVMIRK